MSGKDSSLTKSHSSSSLLLNSANLSWTQPSGGILVTPQPPIEPLVTTKSQSTHDIINSLRTTTSNSSLNSLDNFQTISLDNNTINNTIKSTQDFNFDAIPGYLLGLQQLSLKDPLITSSSTNDNSFNTTSIADFPQNSNISQFKTESNENVSQLESTLTPNSFQSHYFEPNYSRDHSSGAQQTVNYYSQTIPSLPLIESQSQPQQMCSTPPQPPKGSFSRDYKIKGPLRLYDPNHGITSMPQNPMNTTINSSQTFTTSPYCEPVINNPEENLYNLSFNYSESHQMKAQSYYNPQQYDNNSSGQQTIDSNSYSFISPTNESLNNSNEWTQQTMGQTNSSTTTDSVNYYTTGINSYSPVVYHWFYQKIIENREVWKPFSYYDSYNLEQALINSQNNGYELVISTDGGRFDVNIYERLRRPVYWSEAPTNVRRCSWFYKKEGHNRFVPYPEDFSAKLEDSYRDALINNRWNFRIEFAEQEFVIMHSSQTIYHYHFDHSMPDGWDSALENPVKPRLVHRGAHQVFDDIEEGEPQKIDHLVFLIHGIGEICDFRFRSIVEVVDDFRAISLSLMRTHYKQYLDCGQLGRIELLPISWHSALHGEETGIDERLKLITLSSIPKLRHFSNDTILDALFYTSPLYCQKIVDNVGSEINRLYELFRSRNPAFCGSIALGGHSLGSLIVFDILAHQLSDDQNLDINEKQFNKSDNNSDAIKSTDIKDIESLLQYLGFSEYLNVFQREKIDFESIILLTETDFQRLELPLGLQKKLLNFIEEYKQINNDINNSSNKSQNSSNELKSDLTRKSSTQSVNYSFESMGIGFPSIIYPKLNFSPSAFFAMGSPIPMFLTVRGIETIGADFRLPTCPAVYNIFHPFDPIAYRIEPMIDSSFVDIKPVLIPHHKGRKRMHLELKESITRMGSDLKQKIFDSIKYTWNSINEFARAHKSVSTSDSQQDIDSAVTQMVEQEMRRNQQTDEELDNNMVYGFDPSSNIRIGLLNNGRRIDYVLQEKPIEIFNEYLFAMASHACYWESEDTALLILKELYGQMGFCSIAQQQQQTQTRTNTSSQPYDHQFIEQQFDNQLIHTNYQ